MSRSSPYLGVIGPVPFHHALDGDLREAEGAVVPSVHLEMVQWLALEGNSSMEDRK